MTDELRCDHDPGASRCARHVTALVADRIYPSLRRRSSDHSEHHDDIIVLIPEDDGNAPAETPPAFPKRACRSKMQIDSQRRRRSDQ